MSGCTVYGAGAGDGGEAPTSGRDGFIAVLSGWDDDGPVSGTMDLEVADDVPTGTVRIRSGAGVTSELDVTGSIGGSSAELAWGDYVASVTISSDSFDGTFELPDGTGGVVAGTRSELGSGQALCGSYDGDDSGVWNFVVTDKGVLRGAFSGWVYGTLDGSVDGGQLSMSWNAPEFEIAGGASGSIADANASGSWTGPEVAGTWASDATVCP